MQSLIEKAIMEPVDVASDPLYTIRLIRLQQEEHVIVVAMEHIISDAHSMTVLIRELMLAYAAISRGDAPSMTVMSPGFLQHALGQRNALNAASENEQARSDDDRLRCKLARLPARAAPGDELGWGTVPIIIEGKMQDKLLSWCRRHQTTPSIAVFTTYAALILRWCKASEAVIGYQSDGRVDHRMIDAIGCFSTTLYLLVSAVEEDDFRSLMHRIKHEYCQAYERPDSSCIDTQVMRTELTRSPVFNWIPASSTVSHEVCGSEGELTLSPIVFAHPMLRTLELDSEPVVMICDKGAKMIGEVSFPLRRFQVCTMERFAGNLMTFVQLLVEDAPTRIKDISLN
jgi:hypothetical protein